MAEWVDKPGVIIRMGCFDDDPVDKPVAHIWLSESAPWYDPTDDILKLDEGRPRRKST